MNGIGSQWCAGRDRAAGWEPDLGLMVRKMFFNDPGIGETGMVRSTCEMASASFCSKARTSRQLSRPTRSREPRSARQAVP